MAAVAGQHPFPQQAEELRKRSASPSAGHSVFASVPRGGRSVCSQGTDHSGLSTHPTPVARVCTSRAPYSDKLRNLHPLHYPTSACRRCSSPARQASLSIFQETVVSRPRRIKTCDKKENTNKCTYGTVDELHHQHGKIPCWTRSCEEKLMF
jgi:hypothetical protein